MSDNFKKDLTNSRPTSPAVSTEEYTMNQSQRTILTFLQFQVTKLILFIFILFFRNVGFRVFPFERFTHGSLTSQHIVPDSF